MNLPQRITIAILSISCFIQPAHAQQNAGKGGGTPKSGRVVKKGKIWDKVNIVQIPLTAEENGIKGKVKSVRYVSYKISDVSGKPDTVLADSGYNVYDRYGHLVDQNEYDEKGNKKWMCIYTYDKNNKAVEWNFKFFGERAEEMVTKFVYDDKGNNVERVETSSLAENSGKTVLKYDDRGNNTEEVHYDASGKADRTTLYKYDARDNQIAFIAKWEGHPDRREEAEYDAYGDKVTSSYFKGDSLLSKALYVNDAEGKAIEIREMYPKETGESEVVKYDSWGNEIETVSYKPDGSEDISRWRTLNAYEYDKKGNRIKEVNKISQGSKIILWQYIVTKYTYYE